MRLYLLVLSAFLLTTSLLAQHQENPVGSAKDLNLPEWARLMYVENPDPGKVIDAYEAYYQTHPFVKNGHTQYYKHWLRNISRDINGLTFGEGQPLNRSEVLANEAAFIAKSKQIAQSESPTAQWQSVGPYDYDHNASERSYAPGHAHVYTTEQAKSNNDILYAGTATAGLWRSSDYGLNWELTTQNIMVNGIRAIEIDHSNENTVYFGGSGKIYKSVDGGANWTETGDAAFNNTSHSVNDLMMHPTNNQTLWACTENGLYQTTNGGTDWNQVLGGVFQEVEYHPSNSNIIYVVKEISDHTEFYKSTDGGATWNIKPTGWPTLSGSSSVTFDAPSG